MLKKSIVKLGKAAISPVKKTKLFVKQQLGWLQKPIIQPFRGFGNSEFIIVKGRVLEDNSLAQAASKDSYWSNILAMLKRFISDEIPGVNIQVRFYNYEKTVQSNQSGIFEATFDLKDFEAGDKPWHNVEMELLDKVIPHQGKISATGEVLISQKVSQYGVISDVDDTIMISHSFQTVKKLRLMLLKNARTRMPFRGVATFYRALHHGINEKYNNPIFFVSSSEWNLYDLLVDFCRTQDIPKAPFLLKKLKTSFFQLFKSGDSSHMHKLEKIEQILSIYRNTKFILIGDSGQHDAELYAKAVEDFPGRILAVYIRDVRKSRHQEIIQIAREVKSLFGVDMVLVKDTHAAAEHAISNNFIKKDYLLEIKAEERWEEETAPPEV